MYFAPARLLHTESFRISAIFVAMFALTLAALAGSVLVTIDRQFREQIVQFAQSDIAAIRDGYRTEGVAEATEVIDQRMAAPGASDFFLLQRGAGVRMAGNLAPMTPRIGVFDLPNPSGDIRHGILGVGAFIAPGLYAFSGSDTFRAHLARQHIVSTLLWLFAGGMVLACASAAIVSRNFLRRTDAIAATCRAIMDGDLKNRIPVRGTQDELDRLAATINEMLGRIASLMDNLRQVTNDVAHDLRTPVTHLRHRLERARRDCGTPQEYAAALDAAIVKSDEILALFAALLRITQIESGARRAGFAVVDLGQLLENMCDVFGAVAEEAGDRLRLEAGEHAAIRGDRELLVQLLSNLIENAVLHTPAGTSITLSQTVTAESVIVTVMDDGPGVPQEEHAKLFQRLYRREASRTRPGYGLGLALVKAIADLHGANAQVVQQPTAGFAVQIAFPRGAAEH